MQHSPWEVHADAAFSLGGYTQMQHSPWGGGGGGYTQMQHSPWGVYADAAFSLGGIRRCSILPGGVHADAESHRAERWSLRNTLCIWNVGCLCL